MSLIFIKKNLNRWGAHIPAACDTDALPDTAKCVYKAASKGYFHCRLICWLFSQLLV